MGRRDVKQIHTESFGDGEQTVVLSHSFLLDHRHFEPQIRALSPQFRVVAFDHRGHGESDPVPELFGMQDLIDDGIRVIEETDSAPCHWVGLSTGGFVGMRIALQRPDLIRSLVLMSTSAHAEPFLKRAKYAGLTFAVKTFGWKAVVGQALEILFGRTFSSDTSNRAVLDEWRSYIATRDPEGMSRFGNAIWSRREVISRFGEIDVPLLVILGGEDPSFTEAEARAMADNAPHGEFLLLPDAGHISTLTHPEEVNSALLQFLVSASQPLELAL